MSVEPREYELVLMLDPSLEEPARNKLAEDFKAQITGGGTLKHEANWGVRKMTFEIQRHDEADYRWFRFQAPTELLPGLNHNLKISDGVLRSRVFKVKPDAPVIAPPAAGAGPPSREGSSRDDSGSRSAPPAAPAPAAETAPAAEEAPAAEAPAAEPEAAVTAGETEAPVEAAEPEAPAAPEASEAEAVPEASEAEPAPPADE